MNAGETIENYRILELVGRGGMGSVFRAVDLNLDRVVAIKVLNADLRGDPALVERFRHEARIQASLNHPNIATLFGFFVHNNLPVAVIEFIEGETLQDMIRRRGPIPAHISLPLFKQALQGVAAGHRRQIIHRDLKPANLMVTTEGIVKVTDFGIAKLQTATGLTQLSTRIGSSFYMSPEQIVGQKVDTRTDIYAMGITLYELLSGQIPFSATSQYEIENAHVTRPPPAPTIHYPHIPQAAVDAVMRALAKDPAERFQTAEEFSQALPDLQGVPYVGKASNAAPVIVRAEPVQPPAAEPVVVKPEPVVVRPVVTGHVESPPAKRPFPRNAALIGGGLVAALVVAGVATKLLGGDSSGKGESSASSGALLATNDVPRADTSPNVSPPSDPGPPEAASPDNSDASSGTAERVPELPDLSAPDAGTAQPSPPPAPPPAPPRVSSPTVAAARPHDLGGHWRAVYTDATGSNPTLVAEIEVQGGSGEADPKTGVVRYKGVLTYQTPGGGPDKCQIEDGWHPDTRQLQLNVLSCGVPGSYKYFQRAMNFDNVELSAKSLPGGHWPLFLHNKNFSLKMDRMPGAR